jgi:DHA1 family multidrug resistance protein-like MFS transporter
VQSGILGKLTPRYGEKRLALIGLTLLNGCYIVYLLLMLWPDFRVLYPINMVSGGSSAMLFATLGALIANHVADHEQGKAAGVNAALTSLITVIGPLWAGACYDYIGPSAPFWSGVLCLTLTTVMLGASKMRVDHASEKN